MWMPEHLGISGSELANELARASLACFFTVQEPVCGLSASQFRGVVDAWEWEEIPFTGLKPLVSDKLSGSSCC